MKVSVTEMNIKRINFIPRDVYCCAVYSYRTEELISFAVEATSSEMADDKAKEVALRAFKKGRIIVYVRYSNDPIISNPDNVTLEDNRR